MSNRYISLDVRKFTHWSYAALLLGCAACGEGQDAAGAPPPDTARRVAGLGDQLGAVYYDFIGDDGQLAGGVAQVDLSLPENHFIEQEGFVQQDYPFEALRFNGPPDNRIDLVILSDGYTEAELPLYRESVNRIVDGLFSSEVLGDYNHFFNVYRVDVPSNESGVDNDPTDGITKDTAFGSRFGCFGLARRLCVDVTPAISAARSVPTDVDVVMVVANTSTYGGTGYLTDRLLTVTGQHRDAPETAAHEFAHTFANLADEYFENNQTISSEPPEPNASIYQAQQLVDMQHKWYRWILDGTASSFQGAKDAKWGIFRPTENSKMRTLGRPFEAVNNEQLLLNAYQYVRPIGDATPDGVYERGAQFYVLPTAFATASVQWSLDGTPIAGATDTSFDSGTLPYIDGTHTLSVNVVDTTSYVRDEQARATLLSEQRSWALTPGFARNFDQLYLRSSIDDWRLNPMVLVADHVWSGWQLGYSAEDQMRFDVYGDFSWSYGDIEGDGIAERKGEDIRYSTGPGQYEVTFHDQSLSYYSLWYPPPF